MPSAEPSTPIAAISALVARAEPLCAALYNGVRFAVSHTIGSAPRAKSASTTAPSESAAAAASGVAPGSTASGWWSITAGLVRCATVAIAAESALMSSSTGVFAALVRFVAAMIEERAVLIAGLFSHTAEISASRGRHATNAFTTRCIPRSHAHTSASMPVAAPFLHFTS
jgi:hypothetical protein